MLVDLVNLTDDEIGLIRDALKSKYLDLVCDMTDYDVDNEEQQEEELKTEYEKISLREIRKIILNHSPECEHKIQDVVGCQNKVRVKNVVVTEE